ncbi:MAG: DNA primase [Clostridia bacterium]|nr:DNA primase [Clostridia bacterium]
MASSEFQEFVQTLKDKVNIVDVVSGYVQLDRKGNSWWGCCPFHHEKTASFIVNETDKYFHCFGCNASGDVIKFVQDIENVDFMDAVKILADRVKLPVPAPSGADAAKTMELKQRKDMCLKVVNETAHFYLANLRSGKAEQHLKYIESRKLTGKVVTQFGLGASMNFYDLPRYLLDKGYTPQQIQDAGVCTLGEEGRLIDAQGGRLIYPIINSFDEVIAFGGRLLKKADNLAKYKNTKDTIIFNKSKTLYNINLLKKLKKQQKISEVIMVEGYMDTISLYSAGFTNVVASMGTSLTQDQARLIKRYSENILISYDGDSAGQSANARGLEILQDEGLTVKVVSLPEGMDPDDVIKKQGNAGYQACLDAALPLIDFRLKYAENGLDLTNTSDRRKYIQAALRIVKGEKSDSTQEDLLKTIRDRTGTSLQALKDELGKVDLSVAPEQAPAEPRDADAAAERKAMLREWNTKETKASRFVSAAYLFGAKCAEKTDISSVPVFNDLHKIIISYVKNCQEDGEKPRPGDLISSYGVGESHMSSSDARDLGLEGYEMWRVAALSEGDSLQGPVADKYFQDCVYTLRMKQLKDERDRCDRLCKAEQDPDRKREWLMKYQEALSAIRSLTKQARAEKVKEIS